ncbi:MAG: FG-GAP repeat protein [Methylococcaceae bacterium]|nr:FG-GAP repeat protein [Methylococcaceae bacterium]
MAFIPLTMILRHFTAALLLNLSVSSIASAINLQLPNLHEIQLSTPTTLGDKTLGTALSISGSLAAVAALPDNNTHTGSIYLYDAQKSWHLTTELNSAYTTDNFARRIILLDNILVASANRDDTKGTDSGAVYIFQRDLANKTQQWQQIAQLSAPDAQAGDQFGSAIALVNKTLYIGAPFHGQGKVYVFTQNDSTAQWSLQETIEPKDAQALQFGAAIAQNAQTLIIGAPYTDANSPAAKSTIKNNKQRQARFQITRGNTVDPGFESGAIFVYENREGTWQETARIGASNRETGDHLGENIAIEGDMIVAGIKHKDVFDFLGSGAVYVYRKVAETWTEESALFPDINNMRGQFGNSFSILDQHILVGASGIHANGFNSGQAYLFGQDTTGHWSIIHQQANAALQAHDFFGQSVALGSEQILATSKNAVYVFQNAPLETTPAIFYPDSQILQLNEVSVANAGVFSATLQLSQSGEALLLTLTASHLRTDILSSHIQYLAETNQVVIPRLAVPQSNGEMTFFKVTLQQLAHATALQFQVSSIQPLNP